MYFVCRISLVSTSVAERNDQPRRAGCPALHPSKIKVLIQVEQHQHMILDYELIKAALTNGFWY